MSSQHCYGFCNCPNCIAIAATPIVFIVRDALATYTSVLKPWSNCILPLTLLLLLLLLPLLPLALQIDQNLMAGVLSMKDVVKVLLDDQKLEIDSLKDYIHGSW